MHEMKNKKRLLRFLPVNCEEGQSPDEAIYVVERERLPRCFATFAAFGSAQ
jgi:hypothetical protein